MPGTFSPPLRVSDPDMHHGTCVTHVPWCMSGSLTNGFLLSRWRGETFPAFPAHAQPAILRIWQEVHEPCYQGSWWHHRMESSVIFSWQRAGNVAFDVFCVVILNNCSKTVEWFETFVWHPWDTKLKTMQICQLYLVLQLYQMSVLEVNSHLASTPLRQWWWVKFHPASNMATSWKRGIC